MNAEAPPEGENPVIRAVSRPTVIEATLYDGSFNLDFLREGDRVRKWQDPLLGSARSQDLYPSADAEVWDELSHSWLRVPKGHYICRGTKGELFSLDPEVFDTTQRTLAADEPDPTTGPWGDRNKLEVSIDRELGKLGEVHVYMNGQLMFDGVDRIALLGGPGLIDRLLADTPIAGVALWRNENGGVVAHEINPPTRDAEPGSEVEIGDTDMVWAIGEGATEAIQALTDKVTTTT